MINESESGYLNSSPKERLFRGKNVVITGGSSEIGQALVKEFHAIGSHVTVIDNIVGDLPEDAAFFQVDVTNEEALQAALSSIQKVDLLIIAAEVVPEGSSSTQQEIDLMQKVNVVGVINTLEAFHEQLPPVPEDVLNPFSPKIQLVYIGVHDPENVAYGETKDEALRRVADFAGRHKDVDVRLIQAGPIKTKSFLKGRSPEMIQYAQEEKGLYEPEEFASDLADVLTQPLKKGKRGQRQLLYNKKTS